MPHLCDCCQQRHIVQCHILWLLLATSNFTMPHFNGCCLERQNVPCYMLWLLLAASYCTMLHVVAAASSVILYHSTFCGCCQQRIVAASSSLILFCATFWWSYFIAVLNHTMSDFNTCVCKIMILIVSSSKMYYKLLYYM